MRLQIVSSLSSTTARTHELRRRLALCFYFDSPAYSTAHSHTLISISAFHTRLDDPAFDTNPRTDYKELSSLIALLDIAIDDGCPTSLDLTDPIIETTFNGEIEAFAAGIKDIMRNIGNPGAGFISRIEAKEALEMVSQRIGDTLRTKPKKKQKWFGSERPKENVGSAKMMAAWRSKGSEKKAGGEGVVNGV
jgi:hypothetical protein